MPPPARRVRTLPLTTRRLLVVAALLAAVLLALGEARPRASTGLQPPPYDPGFPASFENFESPAPCDGDPAPGATTDLRLRLCLGWNSDCTVRDSPVTDAFFQSVTTFIPPSWSIASGETLPVGALAGRLNAEGTLGLANNPCGNRVAYPLTLLNASLNTADLLPGAVLADTDANGLPDGVEHYPPFALNALDPDLTSYGPDLIPNTGDDVNGPLDPPAPVARLLAITTLTPFLAEVVHILVLPPGSTTPGPDGPMTHDPALGYPVALVLNDPNAPPQQSPFNDVCTPYLADLVLFGRTRDNPCTPAPFSGNANCPAIQLPALRSLPLFPCEPGNTADDDRDGFVNDGCPQVNSQPETGADCLDNISNDAEDGTVNDGCPPVDFSEDRFVPDVDGCDGDDNEASCTFLANPPAAGPAEFVLFTSSYRDSDGDALDNLLDTCPYTVNPAWNPRLHDVGDADQDGLADECDPDPLTRSPDRDCFPLGITGSDEDQDCLANMLDNCPFVNQLQFPKKPPSPGGPDENLTVALDRDEDGIGDACDADPLTPDGQFAGVCMHATLYLGGTETQSAAVRQPLAAGACRPGIERTWGDNNCDGSAGAEDALDPLRHVAGLAPLA